MRLAPHFTLAELTLSQEAARKGWDNRPPASIMPALERTAQKLEEVRALLGGNAIVVSSGYRAPKVNVAIGGSHTSAHCLGHAADFTCPGFGTPLEVARAIAASPLMKGVDQLIYEHRAWVHISFDPRASLKGRAGSVPGPRGHQLTIYRNRRGEVVTAQKLFEP